MWAQLMKMHMLPGKDNELDEVFEQLQATEQPDSGLLRTTVMRDQSNNGDVYTLIVFESEEKARAREQEPQRQEALRPLQARMAEIFDGPPEFIDLGVLRDLVR
jgi:quinol monooxygenase YgiN